MAGSTQATFTGQRSCCQHGSGITGASAGQPGAVQARMDTPGSPQSFPRGARLSPSTHSPEDTRPNTTTSTPPPANPDIPGIPHPAPLGTSSTAMPTRSLHITARQGRDLPCHPTTASKPGEGLENRDQSYSPLPEPQGRKPRPTLPSA